MKFGPYEVLGELGRGGMGIVYRVRAPDGREAALKVLARADPGALARFERERRLLASLGEAEGFVGLLDAGSSPEGVWLVMPFVPGGTLRSKLDRGPLGVAETVALGIELARALGAAHERGIVHRDLKPENVLFSAGGRALLSDLGLAKHFDPLARGASQSVHLTRSGSFTGTAGYMAPEQIEDARSAGPAADVFALGAVLYECLAGRPAFEGATAVELMVSVTSGRVAPIGRPSVPAWLEQVVRRALARSPGERFPDGAWLAHALARGAEARKAPRRSLLLVVLGAVAGGGLLASVALALERSWRLPETRPPGPQRGGLSARELLDRAGRKLAANDFDGASADATKAIELEPGLALAWRVRGHVRGCKGDWDGTIADETRAVELDPRLALAWSDRAGAHGGKHEWAEEIADATRALELNPRISAAWTERGAARLESGDLEGAVADATNALALDPRLAAAWANRGFARARTGDRGGAMTDLTQALELDPALVSAWLFRASLRCEQRDWTGAIEDYDRAIERAPRNADAWASRGWARGNKQDWQGASDDCTRALELDPRLAKAWAYRGAARGDRGDWQGQVDDETKALELDPGRATAWSDRAAARASLGDWRGAIDDCTRAIELDPTLTQAWTNRGTGRANTGDIPGAIADYERVIQIAPTGPAADRARQLLDEARKHLR